MSSWPQGSRDDSYALLYALIVVAAATVDRLLHRATVVSIDGESYRRRAHGAHLNQLREASSPGTP